MSVTAQTKAMIDRCQCYWYEKYVLKRKPYEGRRRPKGLFISCAGSSKPIVFDPAIHVVKSFFAAIDYEYAGEILLSNTDDPDLNARKETVLEEARAAGRRICQ
jgi:multimeric flavodoxin WrbA